jgi:protein O-mannosyl-transferase
MSKPKNKPAAKSPSAPATPIAAATAPKPERWLPWALAALAFALFATGLNNQMVAMDDHSATINNEMVKNFPTGLFSRFNLGMYAPLTWSGYGIAYTIGKNSPFWYHLLSALVHGVNVWLVFSLFFRLERKVTTAAIVAAAFAIHPMQVEAVSWIAGFSTPLFSMFFLAALWSYLRYVDEGETRLYWAALGLFLLSCLSKTAAVPLPLVLLVLDYWRQRPLNQRLILEKIPFFLVALGFGILTLYSRNTTGHTIASDTAAYSLGDRFLMACHTVWFYWVKLIVPTNLSVWYPFEKTAAGGWHWTYYAAPLGLAGLGGLAWWLRRTYPPLLSGLLFYGVNVALALPFYTIGTFELRSDRYNYIAGLGMFFLLATLFEWVRRNRPGWTTAFSGFLVALGLFWMVQTLRRISDWRDTITLVNKAIEASGDNFGQAWQWLGMTYGGKGDAKQAIFYFDKAIARNPNLYECYKYRGALLGRDKQFERSVQDLTMYLQKRPNDAEMLYNRGLSYMALQRYNDALADFNRTIALKPKFGRAYQSRANAYEALGDTVKAAADRQKVTGEE